MDLSVLKQKICKKERKYLEDKKKK